MLAPLTYSQKVLLQKHQQGSQPTHHSRITLHQLTPRGHTRTHTCAHGIRNTHTHTHIYIYKHTPLLSKERQSQRHTHTHTCSCRARYIQILTHTHTHIHTHTSSCRATHTHTLEPTVCVCVCISAHSGFLWFPHIDIEGAHLEDRQHGQYCRLSVRTNTAGYRDRKSVV